MVTSTVAAPVMAGGPQLVQTPVVSVNVGGSASQQQQRANNQENVSATPAAQQASTESNVEQATAMSNTVAQQQDSTLGLSETMDLSQEPGLHYIIFYFS